MRPAPPPSLQTRGYALVVTAAVLWGLIGLFARTILDAGVGPLEIAFWRALIAGGAFALHARLAGRSKLRSARDLGLLAAFALVGVTLFYASLNLAIDAGGVSLAFVLLYTAPAFVAVLAWPLLGERLTRRKGALVLLAVAGVVLVAQAGGGGVHATPAAVAWGLASGASYATYYLFGKWVLHRYAPVTIFAVVLPIGALGLLPFVDFVPKASDTWAWLAVLGLVSTYLAYLVYYTGLRTTEASRAVLVATVEPVVAAAIAAIAFGERLGGVGWTGAALIL
ncbi:MAG: EamA family transporter, partial [Trueperaceae bacterium]|nr:EamA family transporter [Trueperaceae bacterium]